MAYSRRFPSKSELTEKIIAALREGNVPQMSVEALEEAEQAMEEIKNNQGYRKIKDLDSENVPWQLTK